MFDLGRVDLGYYGEQCSPMVHPSIMLSDVSNVSIKTSEVTTVPIPAHLVASSSFYAGDALNPTLTVLCEAEACNRLHIVRDRHDVPRAGPHNDPSWRSFRDALNKLRPIFCGGVLNATYYDVYWESYVRPAVVETQLAMERLIIYGSPRYVSLVQEVEDWRRERALDGVEAPTRPELLVQYLRNSRDYHKFVTAGMLLDVLGVCYPYSAFTELRLLPPARRSYALIERRYSWPRATQVLDSVMRKRVRAQVQGRRYSVDHAAHREDSRETERAKTRRHWERKSQVAEAILIAPRAV